jgi:hypothetical protein
MGVLRGRHVEWGWVFRGDVTRSGDGCFEGTSRGAVMGALGGRHVEW